MAKRKVEAAPVKKERPAQTAADRRDYLRKKAGWPALKEEKETS